MRMIESDTRILVASFALFVTWVVCTNPADAANNVRPPNIVLIMADDIGCETLGCYGGTSYETPHLDDLAASGTRFQHCFSMPLCHPSRITMMTGRYPSHIGNPEWGTFPKAAQKETFAHVMKEAGYATAVAGKWQLSLLKEDPQHPHLLGFDEYCLFGWHEGPRFYQPFIWQNGIVRDDVNDRYGPEVYCNFLIDFITRNQDRPLFAYYPMSLCHEVTDDMEQPVPFGPKGRYDSFKEMIEAMDVQVGRLVAALDHLKLREKTVILFVSDNGTPKTGFLSVVDGKLVSETIVSKLGDDSVSGEKGELTDLGTHVPLIASWKGTLSAGQVVDDLVDFSDFLPTLADLGGVSTPKGVRIDGYSFAARLRGESASTRPWAYAENEDLNYFVRTSRWKLYNDGRLFDLVNDPREKTSVRGTVSQDAQAARKKLEAALVSLQDRN